jgi:hypothetical protein
VVLARVLGLKDRVQALGRLGFPKLLQGPSLELANALPGKSQGLPDLLQSMFFFASEPVAKAQNQLLARSQRSNERAYACSHSIVIDAAIGERCPLVGYEVLKPLLGPGHVRLKGNGFPRESVQGLKRICVGPKGRRQFCGRRIPPEFPCQFRTNTLAALESVVNMRRQANGSGMVLDGSNECLTDPPDSIRGELEASAMIELLHRPNQPQVAFLD